jgi:hypothetical protein
MFLIHPTSGHFSCVSRCEYPARWLAAFFAYRNEAALSVQKSDLLVSQSSLLVAVSLAHLFFFLVFYRSGFRIFAHSVSCPACFPT